MDGAEDLGRDQTKELGCYPMGDSELKTCFNLESIMAGVWLGSSLWQLWGSKFGKAEAWRPRDQAGRELVMEKSPRERGILASGDLLGPPSELVVICAGFEEKP